MSIEEETSRDKQLETWNYLRKLQIEMHYFWRETEEAIKQNALVGQTLKAAVTMYAKRADDLQIQLNKEAQRLKSIGVKLR